MSGDQAIVSAQSETAADLALRSDIRMLGELLGETIVRHHGQGLLDKVEQVGSGLKAAREAGFEAELKEMLSSWTFFSNFISNVEMTLAKTDLSVAKNYVESLVPEHLKHMFDQINSEFEITKNEILNLTGEAKILEGNPLLDRTLAVRDTYLLPLHHLQITLLNRARVAREQGEEVDTQLKRALSLTVNGIATGLRNTG